MPRKGHSEEKIVYALRQVEAGKKVAEICREMGVSPQAFYSWKRRYAGDYECICGGIETRNMVPMLMAYGVRSAPR